MTVVVRLRRAAAIAREVARSTLFYWPRVSIAPVKIGWWQ